MTDQTISNQSPFCNEKDHRAADRTARAASFEALGYPFNPETGTWQLKPKKKWLPAISHDMSRQFLCLPDEDYTDSVCLLLPDGHATLIDVEMFEWASSIDWQVLGRSIFYIERFPVSYIRRRCGTGRTGYGKFRIPAKTRMISLHRAIFEKAPKDSIDRWNRQLVMRKKHIDHRNQIPWDNRIANLRVATPSQNAHNRPKPKRGSSQYKGVSKVKGKEKWVAQICLRGKTHHLGTFDDEFKAAQAYNAFVRKNCPEFGYVNPLSC